MTDGQFYIIVAHDVYSYPTPDPILHGCMYTCSINSITAAASYERLQVQVSVILLYALLWIEPFGCEGSCIDTLTRNRQQQHV